MPFGKEGLVASIAQFAITAAYKYAPAREISVFDYSQIVFATIWGLYFWRDPRYLQLYRLWNYIFDCNYSLVIFEKSYKTS